MSAISPTKNTGLIVDEFISYATAHLKTVSGVASTVSLFPPAGTPNPGDDAGASRWLGHCAIRGR